MLSRLLSRGIYDLRYRRVTPDLAADILFT